MTLVKDYNTEDIENYAKLIARGRPSFIEVKGVTFCGYSGSDALTMANVPFQQEVMDFVRKLNECLNGEYDIACEHAHSCSVLVAHKKFKINGEWYTWIDYDRFHEVG